MSDDAWPVCALEHDEIGLYFDLMFLGLCLCPCADTAIDQRAGDYKRNIAFGAFLKLSASQFGHWDLALNV